MPEVVKYGISNLTRIGRFPSCISLVTDGRLKCALIKNSLPPGKLFICHTNALSSGVYFAEPIACLNFGESASDGTGIIISTLFAVDLLLNCDFALKFIHYINNENLYKMPLS